MREPTHFKSQTEILNSVFNYLVKHGLENVSIRELCKDTGMASGSVYHWFENKDSLLCDAAEYGLKKVVDDIFRYAYSNVDNLEMFFETCLDKVDCYKKELRFIYQIAASPVYGERMRSKENEITYMYDEYADKLATCLNKDKKRIRMLVYMFIATVLDYIIWEDVEKTKMQLEFVYEALVG